jgi:lambda repressor-like predicted transcriptional regulator
MPLHQRGAEMGEPAARFGVHKHTITQCLKRLGVPLQRPGLRDDDVDEAAQLYTDGWSLVGLGEKYGCTYSSVKNALLRHGYRLRPRPGWQYRAALRRAHPVTGRDARYASGRASISRPSATRSCVLPAPE